MPKRVLENRTFFSESVRSRAGVSRAYLAVLTGGMVALALLVAWSCRTTRSTYIPTHTAPGSIEISSVEGAGARPEPMIRVRIERETKETELSGSGPWLIAVSGSHSGEILEGPVRVNASKGGIRLTDARGNVRGFGPGTSVYAGPVTTPNDRPGEEVVSVDRYRYPGTLRLHPRADVGPDVFDVVNVVEIERYVPGVIAKELYPHWSEDAFRAQSVAARTFALDRREDARAAGRWYDVDDSQMDQVYEGLTGLRVAIHAAEATRGIVLTRRGGLAEAFYSSTCGGKPALPEEVWPPSAPTVRNVALTHTHDEADPASREILCESAPLYHWQVARRTLELSERVRLWGKSRSHPAARLGLLTKVEVVQRSETGRSLMLELTDVRGERITMTAEHFRAACNSSQPGLPEVTRAARIHSGDVTVEIGQSITRLTGFGSGHGVGMCQYCAEGMAQRGDDWRTLLTTFYPDAQLVRIY